MRLLPLVALLTCAGCGVGTPVAEYERRQAEILREKDAVHSRIDVETAVRGENDVSTGSNPDPSPSDGATSKE